jgi:hypothetical protein
MHYNRFFLDQSFTKSENPSIPDVGDSLDPVGALAKVKAKNDKKKIFISQLKSKHPKPCQFEGGKLTTIS